MGAQSEIEERYRMAMEAIRKAGKITWDYFRDGVPCELKSDESPVTIADRDCESFLREAIRRAFPNDGFLGEEFGEEPTRTGFRWIIDPIDATANFVRGIPIYGVLVGIEFNDSLDAGLCYVPGSDDLYRAMRGDGAFKNDRAIRVSEVGDLEQSQIIYPERRMFERRGLLPFFDAMMTTCKRARGFGDYWQFLLVAQGSAEVALEPYAAPWDLAALKPIVEEAGGVFTDWEGKPTIYSGGAIAGNPRAHAAALQLLRSCRS